MNDLNLSRSRKTAGKEAAKPQSDLDPRVVAFIVALAKEIAREDHQAEQSRPRETQAQREQDLDTRATARRVRSPDDAATGPKGGGRR